MDAQSAPATKSPEGDRRAWERSCPNCGRPMTLQRKLPPKWNWTGMEVSSRVWRCSSCYYAEPDAR